MWVCTRGFRSRATILNSHQWYTADCTDHSIRMRLETLGIYFPRRPSTREVCGPDLRVYGEHVVNQ